MVKSSLEKLKRTIGGTFNEEVVGTQTFATEISGGRNVATEHRLI